MASGKQMKKALIFDPYLDTLGGGERYSLTFALGLLSSGYSVEVAWKDTDTLRAAEERFGLDLSKIKVNHKAYDLCVGKTSLFQKFLFTIRYSLIFWVSDGSLPFLFSMNNLLHFQIPFKTIGGNAFINNLKTLFIRKFVYNSQFTAAVHETHFPKSKSFILYPPVDVESFRPGNKENIILSVARFDSPSHPKRQDVLIDAFKILNKSFPDYQLILAGGSLLGSEILEKLKLQAGSLPVKFVVGPDFTKLKSLYAKSKFFWHAAGYEIDEVQDPERVEHFGITTVEAMSAGCIPVVIGKGGQKEILSTGGGFLCADAQEMASLTKDLIKDSALYEKSKADAQNISSQYATVEFIKKINSLV
jgi:glycosyltransferase involved in cell wall biosynthesis